ncbi:DNA phosphorothioation-associated putative methyltransferase [Cryptosporangium sp. NPDC051539]|uniref:DNA phosphorothioation-associated putative methyltransferase n=1 Tax=Cryptosporangium sp. NPDC051539 TaxID=3363962 RepID=UPI0037A44AFE
MARERTAISRDRLSVPARRAVDHGLIDATCSVLDYGCGRGDDLAHFQELGIRATGWDPHYRPQPPPAHADVVLLTYVLNTIDDLDERRHTLQAALRLARRCLVVSTRLRWDEVTGDDHADGVITSRNTFQALHRPREFRLWLQHVTGIRPLSGGPETAYLFTSAEARIAFVHGQFARTEQGDATAGMQPLQRLARHLQRYGRMPTTEEQPNLIENLTANYGSTTRARRAADRITPPTATALAAKRRTADLVVALAMDTFHGRPRFNDLPAEGRADIRAFFGSYTKGYRTAETVLKAAGQPDQIRRSITSARTGKITPTSLYVHVDALRRLPAILRILEACAQLLSGRPEAANIVRLRHDMPVVSYLYYPGFDSDPHPEQESATHVDLGGLQVKYVSHQNSEDPPILHRREEFVADNHPRRADWVRQTAREVSTGAFDHPHLIGSRSGWQKVLTQISHPLVAPDLADKSK